MSAPALVRPGKFTFYEQLPGLYKSIQFTQRNKKLSPESKRVFEGVQSFINRLIHLRRNYKVSAYDVLEVRMYPREDFEDSKDTAIYSFALEGSLCNSKDEVFICLHAPYALDGETRISVRVYAAEVTDKEAKDVRKQDKEREEELASIHGGDIR